MYFSKLQNVFVQMLKHIFIIAGTIIAEINKVVSFAVSGTLLEAQMALLHPRGLLQEKKHPKTQFLQKPIFQSK